MLTSIHRETLERFYHRAYGDYRPLRVGSVFVVAALTAYTGVWPIWLAALWALSYVAGEAALMVWWRRIQPTLATASLPEVLRRQSELIAICAVACAICAAPGFVTPFAGHDNQIIGAVLSAAIVLVAAAEHSLRKDMFLITAPPAAAAMVWNLFALGDGASAWIFAGLGLCYVGNALALQQSNVKVFRDLLRLRADAEAANIAKSDFLATVSHEIRTPLNGVLGMAQLMARSDLSAAQREQLAVIADSGQALLGVLNGILDLSKIESGKTDIEAHAFDLDQIIQATSAAFAPMALEKRLAFSAEVSPELSGTWRGDATRIRQVLSNLLSNAVKFTSSGAVRLDVQPVADGVAFRVTDTGIGVAPDKLEAIFEKFTQADSSTTRRFGGTGLGLAICQRLVVLMGGRIQVESRLGEGSAFTVVVPLQRLEAAVEAPSVAIGSTPAARLVRVLAAEDNATNQLILSALLEPLGVDLTVVGDGEAAVEALAGERFDIILMDVQMPRMDGLAATAAIRRAERRDGRPHTPIVALTANVMPQQVEQYLAAGMDGHVAKPLDLSELLAAVDAALSDSPREDSPEPRERLACAGG